MMEGPESCTRCRHTTRQRKFTRLRTSFARTRGSVPSRSHSKMATALPLTSDGPSPPKIDHVRYRRLAIDEVGPREQQCCPIAGKVRPHVGGLDPVGLAV